MWPWRSGTDSAWWRRCSASTTAPGRRPSACSNGTSRRRIRNPCRPSRSDSKPPPRRTPPPRAVRVMPAVPSRTRHLLSRPRSPATRRRTRCRPGRWLPPSTIPWPWAFWPLVSSCWSSRPCSGRVCAGAWVGETPDRPGLTRADRVRRSDRMGPRGLPGPLGLPRQRGLRRAGRCVGSAPTRHLAGPALRDVRIGQSGQDLLPEVIGEQIVAGGIEDLLLFVVVGLETVFEGLPHRSDLTACGAGLQLSRDLIHAIPQLAVFAEHDEDRPHEATGLHRREVENLFDIDVMAQASSSCGEGLGVDLPVFPQRFREGLEVSVDAVVVPFEHFSDAELTTLF